MPVSRKSLWMITVMIVTLLGLAGCAGVGKTLQPPRITLAQIRPLEVKALETVFQIELRVFNTNDVPLNINGIECELKFNGQKFALGVSNAKKKIPSYGTDTIPITVYSSVVDIIRGVMELQGKEKLEYTIAGQVRLGDGLLSPSTIPFSSTGELSLEAIGEPAG